jgi:hypothetical protein
MLPRLGRAFLHFLCKLCAESADVPTDTATHTIGKQPNFRPARPLADHPETLD